MTGKKKRVLVVEDSPIVLKIIGHMVRQELDESLYEVDFVDSMAAASQLMEEHTYFAALADLNLPDAPNGEVVDSVLAKGIPCIVLTGTYSEERRESLLKLGIVDYVVKESRFSYAYAVKLVNRLALNEFIKVLVVEDSTTARNYVKGLLEQHLFQVLEAENGLQALDIYKQHPEIRLIITDYHMPEMDGFELVREIRGQSDKTDLAIIGLSSVEKSALSAKFIKNGANDFLQKPFFPEELHCRVIHNLESIELIQALNDAANSDYLTKLYNRRYLFDVGGAQYDHAQPNKPFAVALMDIDHFKAFNDNYGHEAGDAMLVHVGQLLKESFSRFLVARMGGEEFCVLLPGLSQNQAYTLMNNFRTRFEDEGMYLGDEYIQATISIGVTSMKGDNLDSMIATADELLYRAKEVGRNFVIGDDSA
ncbi:diguanylate cyclase [Litoribacillus peritrichatus]|uniref:diguanylate cyclase n=1 Tax=Litoribacillus peritrichatus TaxID=718191 RepID=A0ABP7MYR8_9GAMM